MITNNDNSEILTIEQLAFELHLSVAFLRRETNAGRIPYLRAGNRLRFNPTAVRTALAAQASRRECE